MSFSRAFDDLFSDVVVLEPFVRQDGSGVPTFGAPVQIAARIESEVPKETNAPAEETVSYSRVFVKPTTTSGAAYVLGALDRLTLPAGYVRAVAIVSVSRKNDERGLHHFVLRVLQRQSALLREITLQKPVKLQDPDTGEPVLTWVDVASVPATVRPVSGEESYADVQQVAWGVATFRIDFPAEMPTPEWRVRYQQRFYDVLDVRELGQRQAVELLGKVRTA